MESRLVPYSPWKLVPIFHHDENSSLEDWSPDAMMMTQKAPSEGHYTPKGGSERPQRQNFANTTTPGTGLERLSRAATAILSINFLHGHA